MTFDELLDNLNPEIIASLKRAVELGKWPNGVELTEQQRRLCVEAVITWERRNLPPEEQIGYIPPKKAPCSGADKEEKLRWVSEKSE